MTKTDITFEPGRQDIIVRREFDAPPDVVFDAITDPDLIPRWWASRRFATEVDQMEVRRGGLWRFITRNTPIMPSLALSRGAVVSPVLVGFAD